LDRPQHHWRLVHRANWSNGVPTCSLDAYINNGGGAAINSGATALSLTLGENTTDSGRVSVDGTNGGNLVVQACGNGPLGDITVGYQGTGALSISNGGFVGSGSGYIAASTSTSASSNGSVTVTGSSSTWQVGNPNTFHSVLFVGGNENGTGGTALLSITNGGSVTVQNNSGGSAVTVGPSGTLTGNGALGTTSSTVPLTTVTGTLAPSGGQLTVAGDLQLNSTATTKCNVTPQDPSTTPQVSVSGQVSLGGRLSVTMTGDFSSAPRRFTLLYADSVNSMHRTFDSQSITYPTGQGCWVPQITYDYTGGHVHVYLDRVYTCN
jgi:hypothetical protein